MTLYKFVTAGICVLMVVKDHLTIIKITFKKVKTQTTAHRI